MSTVREICTRALKRAGITAATETPAAEDAQTTLNLLNEMVFGWAAEGVDVLQQAPFGFDDPFLFWVPPLELSAEVIAVQSFAGAWDASANSPALSSSVGTTGAVYRVSTAGNTALDDVASWALDDFAVFDGRVWHKGISSLRFDGGVIAMLCVRVCGDFQQPMSDVVVAQARSAWTTMLPYYVKPPKAGFDMALRMMPSRSIAVAFEEL